MYVCLRTQRLCEEEEYMGPVFWAKKETTWLQNLPTRSSIFIAKLNEPRPARLEVELELLVDRYIIDQSPFILSIPDLSNSPENLATFITIRIKIGRISVDYFVSWVLLGSASLWRASCDQSLPPRSREKMADFRTREHETPPTRLYISCANIPQNLPSHR